MSRAGFATVDITPPVGIDMLGYHRSEPSQGVRDRLWATAAVFSHERTTCVIVGVDHAGMLVSHTNQVRGRISDQLGIPTSHVMVHFTHTHSGPETSLDEPLSRRYRSTLQDRLVEATVEAHSRLRPCCISFGTADTDAAVNRRVHDDDGSARMGVNPEGPVDRRVAVLQVHDAETSTPLGALVTCTAHANVLKADNLLISADFPGALRQRLRKTLGCRVFVRIGAAGDVHSWWRGSAEAVKRTALAFYDSAMEAVSAAAAPRPIDRLRSASQRIQMDLQPLPEPDEARALADTVAEEWGVDTRPWLDRVMSYRKAGRRRLSLDLEVQLCDIDGFVLAGIPMEPFSETALTIAGTLGSDVFFGGCTNGWIGYLPTASEFRYGGYEVEWVPVVYGVNTGCLMPAEPGTAQKVVGAVKGLTNG